MSKKLLSLLIAAGVFSAIAVGCGSDPAPADDDDTTTTKKDAGKKKVVSTDDTGTDSTGTDDPGIKPTTDAAVALKDSGTTKPKDSGTVPVVDSGVTPVVDSGVVVDSGTAVVDSGVTVVDSGVTPPPPACYAKAKATGYTTSVYPTGHAHQTGKCSDAQINAFASTCGTDLAANTVSACFSKIQTQSSTCANCILTTFGAGVTPSNTGPFYNANGSAGVNIEGCIDIATKVAGCGSKYSNYADCVIGACDTCTADADRSSCYDHAFEDACYTQLDSACATAINANTAAVDACYSASGSAADITTWVKSISAAYCK